MSDCLFLATCSCTWLTCSCKQLLLVFVTALTSLTICAYISDHPLLWYKLYCPVKFIAVCWSPKTRRAAKKRYTYTHDYTLFSTPSYANLPSVQLLITPNNVPLSYTHKASPCWCTQFQKICCRLQGCRRTFTNFTTFRNHIYSHHDFNREDDLGHNLEIETEPAADEDESNGMDESLNCGDANSTETQTTGDDLFTEDSQQRAPAVWILKAREQHCLPLSVMDAMIGDFQSLHEVAMTSCRQKVERALTGTGISEDIIASAMVHMTEESPYMLDSYLFRNLF